MSQHIARNVVTLLLVLTLANLAASFAALRTLRAVHAQYCTATQAAKP